MWDKNVPAAVFMRGWILAAAIAVVKKSFRQTKECGEDGVAGRTNGRNDPKITPLNRMICKHRIDGAVLDSSYPARVEV